MPTMMPRTQNLHNDGAPGKVRDHRGERGIPSGRSHRLTVRIQRVDVRVPDRRHAEDQAAAEHAPPPLHPCLTASKVGNPPRVPATATIDVRGGALMCEASAASNEVLHGKQDHLAIRSRMTHQSGDIVKRRPVRTA